MALVAQATVVRRPGRGLCQEIVRNMVKVPFELEPLTVFRCCLSKASCAHSVACEGKDGVKARILFSA